ncbi:hypothetical protein U9M48_003765 [Paspalum notatum var. saurae]|uniref:Uncharacterized protein n=1 Tax=Paspalum notatum var. saurae TaxID=547442 RepID=A0AAQ3PJE5_PASNO
MKTIHVKKPDLSFARLEPSERSAPERISPTPIELGPGDGVGLVRSREAHDSNLSRESSNMHALAGVELEAATTT